MREKRIHAERAKHHSLQTAFIFFIVIFLLIIGSFAIKLVSILQQSLFDGDHRFTILFENANDKKKDGLLLSFSPSEKTMSLLQLENLKSTSFQKMSVISGTPIDAFVTFAKPVGMETVENTKDVTVLLQTGIKQYQSLHTNLTIVDFVRLWFFAKGVIGYNISEKEYTLLKNNMSATDPVLDKMISSLFTDATISQEKMTIHVVNASGGIGLGNRLARVLTNTGGNVIAVSTADQIYPISQIAVIQKDRYTVKKLARFLRMPVVSLSKRDGALSDIVIIIGKDRSSFFSL